MFKYVLFMALLGLFPACGEDKGSSPLPSEGEGQGEGEGEGPIGGEGEGEGSSAEGEGEGEGSCIRALEVCNGLDDDCDGETDDPDDLTAAGTIGAACGTDEGECAKGIEECIDRAIVCSGEVGPTDQETCDNLDNDCDGETDEEYDVDASCVVGIGACQVEGLTRCSDDGGRTECDAHPGSPAQTETCINSLDDDCDGSVDEGCECNTGTSRSCGDTDEGVCELGQQSCGPDGQWSPCVGLVGPSEETCNGLDDDCNGQTDNGFDVNANCEVGIGTCRRSGNKRCNQAGNATECNAIAGQPGIEMCNALDDDCDGETDDAPIDVGEMCVAGVGQCLRADVTVCRNGQETCNAIAGQPDIETCNDLDDDCDGETDDPDDLTAAGTIGAACGTDEGECAKGIEECIDGTIVCSGEIGPADQETCDNLDNDCDGQTDDAPTDVGEACAAGVGQCLRADVTVCRNGQETCNAIAGQPDIETCNDLDDDCDGETDEEPCPSLTGNWSWTVTRSDNNLAFSAYHALVEDPATHIVTGSSIDSYGLARWNGSLLPADGSFDVTKRYSSGTSVGLSFRYTGIIQGAAENRQLSGTWRNIADPTQNGRMTGSVQSALAVDRVSGNWTIRADFGNIVTRLDATVEGRVTGTMSDAFGRATVDGIFDRGGGFLSFRKLYNAGVEWWYSGEVAPDGLSMRNGVYRATSNGAISGRWTAVR